MLYFQIFDACTNTWKVVDERSHTDVQEKIFEQPREKIYIDDYTDITNIRNIHDHRENRTDITNIENVTNVYDKRTDITNFEDIRTDVTNLVSFFFLF